MGLGQVSMNKKFHEYLRVECFENKKMSFIERFKRIRFVPQYRSIYLIRKMLFTDSLLKKRYFSNCLAKEFGIYCGFETQIGIGLKLPHPNGIILGNASSIGENVTIYQQVTVGSARLGDWKKNKQPTIGSECILFAGSKVIGDIKLGNRTTVGANAVLNKDTEDDSVWVGIPARAIKPKSKSDN